jgi:hypothetical protein
VKRGLHLPGATFQRGLHLPGATTTAVSITWTMPTKHLERQTMAIPPRFRATKPTKKLVREMTELCTSIERAVRGTAEQNELIAKWNQKTARQYQLHEFENYWRSIDQAVFVREALCPAAVYVADLTYPEAYDILSEICQATLPEYLMSYYLEFIDVQFPNSRASDLIYWPDNWFDDASCVRDPTGAFKPESNLSTEQILHYLMAKANRQLPNSKVEVSLPFLIPTRW